MPININWNPGGGTIGAILAFIVLVIAIVMILLSKGDKVAWACIGGLAVARLV